MANESHPLVPSACDGSERDMGSPQALSEPQRAVCSFQSSTAASPDGAFWRPLAMSDTVEGAAPIAAAISATVIPFSPARRSAMRDCHVIMCQSLRDPVTLAQRHVVTGFRETRGMSPESEQDWPKQGSHIGERIKYWRNKRGLSRKQLGAACGAAASTIGDLENQLQHSSTKTAQLAAALQINPHYLETGDGDPLRQIQQVPPRHDWPKEFPPVDILNPLEPNELKLAGYKLAEVIAEIKANRTKTSRTKR
jgi:transcriptional regulator with XRE-family HTH domain